MRKSFIAIGVASLVASAAGAALVEVKINGEVEFNQIRTGALAKTIVPAGSATQIRFLLNSDDYLNDPDGLPTRGYTIDQSSFQATFGSVTLGLQNPFPPGATPMFVLRNNDPAVDGFFLSTGTAYPFPLPMTEDGFFGKFGCNFSVGYTGATLSSLNIIDAFGQYDYTGLTNFYWSTDDGGNDAMGMVFENMTIADVPAPATLLGLAPLAMFRRRR